KYRLPIYTLRLPGTRLYIVNTPQLISAVQKNFKALTFQAVTDKFSGLICGTSQEAQDVQKRLLDEWQAAANSAPSPSHTSYKALSPGESLDEMNRTMIQRLAKEVEIIVSGGEEKEVALFEWVKEAVGVATTDGVYGDKNPYRDAGFRRSFWFYEAGVPTLSLGVFPTIFAKPCLEARQRNALILEKYFTSGDYLHGATLTRNRFDWHIASGFPIPDVAKLEVGNGIAILANTVPTAFWAIYHIFSNPAVLSSIREEIIQHVETTTSPETSTTTKHIDISLLKTSSPLFLSSLKESMRLHSVGVGVRQVMTDTTISTPSLPPFLLKKGSLVIMPSQVQHSDPDLWGALDVNAFDIERFVPKAKLKGPNPVSFRAFGGGTTLCPGRHFAITEVLVLVAMLTLRFDIQPVAKGTAWKEMTTEKAPMTAAMPKPDDDVDVVLRQRDDDKGVKWVFNLSAGEKGIAIAAEDM
ncbi:cytochrome P450, partial [Aaosphaeria arxii CBS 175.79]